MSDLPFSPIPNDWRNSNQFDMWLDMEYSQWLSTSEIHALQLARLKPLLIHAFEATTYYHNLFTRINFDPYRVESLDDLARIPVLTKSDIRAHLDDLTARNYPAEARFLNATGGSTGVPMNFYRDCLGEAWLIGASDRFRRWIGYVQQDKLAFIWGAERDIPLAPEPNHRWLNSFKVTPERISTFLREIETWRPRAIRGYASSLYLVAKYIQENRPGISRPLAEAIESSAEKLWGWQRDLIEEAFGCKVFNMYGSREAPCLACECEAHQGLHVFEDLRITEIVNGGVPARPGEAGNIVVTDLVNYSMPFIRYEIGDLGYFAEGDCSCGRGFARLGEVKGRTTSIITTPSGQYVHGEYFTHLFYNKPGVEAFQVHQKSLESVEILVKTSQGFEPAMMDDLLKQINQHLGPGISISWLAVDAIPTAASGKYHFTISDVPLKI
jgi:phenylacetate-CoA ligase